MDPIKRALGYPYDLMATSFLLSDQQILAWNDAINLENRIPVLACGSNQSPTQLARKFPLGTIPVMAGWLIDYDSVYSAHFTSYGSIAATYQPCPSMRSRQMITWLSDEQLEVMHKTEALGVNYEFVELKDISFISDQKALGPVISAYAYQSLHHPLLLDGPVAISPIRAENRTFMAMDQSELQKYLLKIFGFTYGLDEFIRQTIEDSDLRLKRTELLKIRLPAMITSD